MKYALYDLHVQVHHEEHTSWVQPHLLDCLIHLCQLHFRKVRAEREVEHALALPTEAVEVQDEEVEYPLNRVRFQESARQLLPCRQLESHCGDTSVCLWLRMGLEAFTQLGQLVLLGLQARPLQRLLHLLLYPPLLRCCCLLSLFDTQALPGYAVGLSGVEVLLVLLCAQIGSFVSTLRLCLVSRYNSREHTHAIPHPIQQRGLLHVALYAVGDLHCAVGLAHKQS
mmetsp:Transcript_19461/g.43368  ORF Transcript_19461/g.43368 Transcript_19461/m.43368 type:complete len:226 (-) Transcript_19461:770-1447(-)